MNNFNAAFTAAGLGVLMILLEGWLAYKDNFFFISQMRARGIEKGLPFIGHLGMWGDLLIITTIVFALVLRFYGEWSTSQYLIWGLCGLSISAAMHYMYVKAPFPGCHAYDGHLTQAGWVHLIYMAAALTVIFLFYLGTRERVPVSFVVFIGVAIAIHLFIGTLMPLKLLRPSWFVERVSVVDIGLNVGLWALIIWRSIVLTAAH